MCGNTLLLKLLFVPCVWNLLQIKYIFLRNSYFLKIKSFSFSCLLYYYLKGSMLLCFLLLYWVFIKSVFVVCLEVVAVCDILIFKNIAFFVIACSVCFERVFDWEIVWVVCCGFFVIDFTFDWWDGLSCLFWRFVFWIVLSDCLIWLIVPIGCFLLNGCDFVRKKKNYGRTEHCKLPLLNPVSKWVRSDSNGWSFNLGVYCLLWKRFCVLNVALRMTKKLNRLRNSDGYVLVF